MAVVIDEMITEVEPAQAPGPSGEASGEGRAPAVSDASLRRLLERIRERRLRLEADGR